MSIIRQMNKVYAVMERAADRKPNTHVIRKMDELRCIARRFRTTRTHSTTQHPALTARLLRAGGQN